MSLSACLYLSEQPAAQSNKLSRGIAGAMAETIPHSASRPNADTASFNRYVRKNAHFFAYFLLGSLMLNALKQSGGKGLRGYAMVFLGCMAYAAFDEVHQLFVPGRGGRLSDVVIDGAKVIVGLAIYAVFTRGKRSI